MEDCRHAFRARYLNYCGKSITLAFDFHEGISELTAMEYQIKQKDKFRYVEEGVGEPLVLLHGLFGALSNFEKLIEYFRNHYRVIVPMLPLLDMDILHTSVGGLAKFVHRFLEARELNAVHLLGNSLGGHVALIHILKHPERIKSLTLTGRGEPAGLNAFHAADPFISSDA